MWSVGSGWFLTMAGISYQPVWQLSLTARQKVQPQQGQLSPWSDIPSFTVKVSGSGAARLTKHSVPEQHHVLWVQKRYIKHHAGTSSSSIPPFPIFLSKLLSLLGSWTVIQESSPSSPAVFVLGTRASEAEPDCQQIQEAQACIVPRGELFADCICFPEASLQFIPGFTFYPANKHLGSFIPS